MCFCFVLDFCEFDQWLTEVKDGFGKKKIRGKRGLTGKIRDID